MRITAPFRKGVLTIALGVISAGTFAETPTSSEVEELKLRLSQLEERLEATADAQEASKNSNTALGGYGELHYNNWDNKKAGGNDKREFDFHRFVLFFSHEFDTTTRFVSELELEHALLKDTDTDTDGSNPKTNTSKGEVELEQAYIEFNLNDAMTARGGLFLLPIGLLNDTHEPPTFYGVERNPVENKIIPTTWWEAGAGLSHRFPNGLAYDVALHSGLYAPNYNIRDGRQKVSAAKGDALAYTARLKWTGIPGLELAASLNHQNDITQGTAAKISANLLESHLSYTTGPFAVKALYATWRFDDNGAANGMEKQQGWYVEPAFKVSEKFGLFARYNRWDNAAGDATDSVYRQSDVGINYWPHPDVVIKADYQNQSVPNGKDEYDGFNLGIGYQF